MASRVGTSAERGTACAAKQAWGGDSAADCRARVADGKCSNVKCEHHNRMRELALKEPIYEGLLFHDLHGTAI